jgi:hypothetical protein
LLSRSVYAKAKRGALKYYRLKKSPPGDLGVRKLEEISLVFTGESQIHPIFVVLKTIG